ncbi:hypothetical protein Clacol_004492 [Clathrus columnatus]|uniref:Gamma-glutamyltranspeptidase 1 n=1 Tax=Clathrus columnatus TaxID=1419009 RepID=A0AAV5ACP8_9AGAM|nr:hypothetical protein Clacol_004492 [Clathrus columnatus]
MYTNSSNPTASIIGGLSVAIPGELRGWEYLHKRHGKLPWKRLFEHAIRVARDGFAVHARMALKMSDSPKFFTEDDLWAEVYAPNGTLVKEGDIIYQKRYANALQKLAEYGADYFYKGEIANNIIKAYKNHRIFSTSTPSSGSSVLAALKIYEGFPSTFDSDLSLHRLIQANKFAYGQRANHLKGPISVTQLSQAMFLHLNTKLIRHSYSEFLLESTAAAARLKINDSTTCENDFYNSRNYLVIDDHGTCHLAAADSNCMAISLTTTINLVWGSRVMTDDGIILNDEMDDFSSPNSTNAFGYAASPANYIEPYKRPQSSIASTIVEDLDRGGELRMVTGASGGSHIISTTLQYIYHRLEHGLGPEEIVRRPRWHDQLGNSTVLEWSNTGVGLIGFSNVTASYLFSLNYNISYEDPLDSSDGHIIIRDTSGQFHVATDPRVLTGF